MKKLALIIAVLMIASCNQVAEFQNATRGFFSAGQDRLQVTDERVWLIAPEGFCVDPESTRDGPSDAFVLFGNCAAITGNARAKQPAISTAMAATVVNAFPGQAVGLAELETFLGSENGKSAIKDDRISDDIEVRETTTTPNGVLVRYGSVDGENDNFWKSFLIKGSSLISLTPIPGNGLSLSQSESESVLASFGQSFLR